jgi:hypothetical protein
MIDFDKSITDKRLYLQTSFVEKFLVFCVWIIGSISLPFISLTMLYGSLKFNWFYDSAIQIIILMVINFGVSIFVITGLIINRNLTKVSVASNVNPRLLLKDELTMFKSTFIERDSEKELIVNITQGIWRSNKQLIFLFDKSDIYINCMTYARSELISPVHWLIHKKIIKSLIKEIKARQHNTRYSQ